MKPGWNVLSPATPAALALLALVAGIACYNPSIGEGDFVCGANGSCPSGWRCAPDNKCYRSSSAYDAAATDFGPQMPEVRPPDMQPPVDTATPCPRGLACSPGAPANQACDPVCQTGCACNQKCAASDSVPKCVPLPAAPRDFYQTCGALDACRAGAVCVSELREICGAHCYRACRVDSDCAGNGRCIEELRDLQGNFLTKFCGQKAEICNPTGDNTACPGAAPGNRQFPNFSCYLLQAGLDESTGCVCSGTIDVGMPCPGRNTCRPGHECLPSAAGGNRCAKLCTLDPTVAPGQRVTCALPNVCRPIGNSSLRVGACG